MSNNILQKQKVAEAMNALAQGSVVYIPVKNKRNLVEYKAISKEISAADARLEGKPDLPPKAILFPQTETLLTFKRESGKFVVRPVTPVGREKVIFAVRPCDAIGIALMDRVFCGGKFVDSYYEERRNRTTIFTIACDGPADSYCFCPSTGGGPAATEGSDVMLYDVGDAYYVDGLTDKGKKTLKTIESQLGQATADQEKRKEEIIKKAQAAEGFGRQIGQEAISKLDTSFDSKYWEEVARRCLSCGACTYYCPTCHCFDINDEKGGKRVRTWDSCQFGIFTMHTSGHNPRAGKTQKLRNRYYHKFKYSKENIGRFLCVGCGRCVALCPASLDITKVISEVK